ncbi:MAG TPA: hypothetical protein ENK61_03620 [Devosia sp.]|nr:hypothetical protein [Devosia sp.]
MARAILFDIDGVLIHSMFHPDPNRARRWDRYMKDDLGIAREDWSDFFKQRFSSIVRGQTSLLSELANFLPTIGYNESPLTFLAYWLRHDNQLNLQLIEAVKQFSKSPDVQIYLATNQEHIRAFHLWTNVGFSHIFKDMFYAARLGEAKPDFAYFEAVDTLLGPQNAPPLFFDDGQNNVDAANAHGWEGVLFDQTADFTNHPWVKARLPAHIRKT